MLGGATAKSRPSVLRTEGGGFQVTWAVSGLGVFVACLSQSVDEQAGDSKGRELQDL